MCQLNCLFIDELLKALISLYEKVPGLLSFMKSYSHSSIFVIIMMKCLVWRYVVIVIIGLYDDRILEGSFPVTVTADYLFFLTWHFLLWFFLGEAGSVRMFHFKFLNIYYKIALRMIINMISVEMRNYLIGQNWSTKYINTISTRISRRISLRISRRIGPKIVILTPAYKEPCPVWLNWSIKVSFLMRFIPMRLKVSTALARNYVTRDCFGHF